MKQHTVGPWYLERMKGVDGERFTVISDPAEEWIVEGRIETEQDEANLALICAAPELLQALEYLLGRFVDPVTVMATSWQVIADARELVERAKGA